MIHTVRTVSEAMRHVRRFEAVTAEGVGGTLTVSQGYNGCWYGRFSRPWGYIEDCLWFDSGLIHDWLREWWPRLCLPSRSGLNRRGQGKVLPKSFTTPATRPAERRARVLYRGNRGKR